MITTGAVEFSILKCLPFAVFQTGIPSLACEAAFKLVREIYLSAV